MAPITGSHYYVTWGELVDSQNKPVWYIIPSSPQTLALSVLEQVSQGGLYCWLFASGLQTCKKKKMSVSERNEFRHSSCLRILTQISRCWIVISIRLFYFMHFLYIIVHYVYVQSLIGCAPPVKADYIYASGTKCEGISFAGNVSFEFQQSNLQISPDRNSKYTMPV